MNRRDFLKLTGKGAAVVAAAPVLAIIPEIEDKYLLDTSGPTTITLPQATAGMEITIRVGDTVQFANLPPYTVTGVS